MKPINGKWTDNQAAIWGKIKELSKKYGIDNKDMGDLFYLVYNEFRMEFTVNDLIQVLEKPYEKVEKQKEPIYKLGDKVVLGSVLTNNSPLGGHIMKIIGITFYEDGKIGYVLKNSKAVILNDKPMYFIYGPYNEGWIDRKATEKEIESGIADVIIKSEDLYKSLAEIPTLIEQAKGVLPEKVVKMEKLKNKIKAIKEKKDI